MITLEENAIGTEALLELRREFPGGAISEVIGMFEEEGRVLLEQMSEAQERHDANALRRGAHALRGACTHFGARNLEAVCADIEIQARGGSFAPAGMLERVREEYSRVEAALNRECEPGQYV